MISSIGSSCSALSDEYPVPKSSMLTCTPALRSSTRFGSATGSRSIRTLSVNSRVSRAGSICAASSVRSTRVGVSVLRELHARDVDVQREPLASRHRALPVSELAAGLVQHPVAERNDEARLLGDRDELVGPISPWSGCDQRDERLESAQLPRAQIEDRLVVRGGARRCCNGAPQLALQPEPRRHLGMHRALSNTACCALPWALARYIAMSASRITCSGARSRARWS